MKDPSWIRFLHALRAKFFAQESFFVTKIWRRILWEISISHFVRRAFTCCACACVSVSVYVWVHTLRAGKVHYTFVRTHTPGYIHTYAMKWNVEMSKSNENWVGGEEGAAMKKAEGLINHRLEQPVTGREKERDETTRTGTIENQLAWYGASLHFCFSRLAVTKPTKS